MVVGLPQVGGCGLHEFVGTTHCRCKEIYQQLQTIGRGASLPEQDVPNMPMVPPVRVSTPQGPTFCLVSVFCTAEASRPTPPVRAVIFMVDAIASLGW